mmetsp:Transcript_5167/g.8969  ORF Transcript_5167/g.8969 Transcript_5167/m.8969 type:complete len:80 (-) Transcript_5167:827-1066(-)
MMQLRPTTHDATHDATQDATKEPITPTILHANPPKAFRYCWKILGILQLNCCTSIARGALCDLNALSARVWDNDKVYHA